MSSTVSLPAASFDVLVSDLAPFHTLPHNPIQPEGNGNFTASPFSLFIAFSSWVLIQRVSVHHNAWMNVQRCFVSSPQAPKPIWWVGRQIHYALHAILKFLQHIAAELGSSSFVAMEKKSCIILIYDCLISFAVIWYDGACQLLLSYICVCCIVVCDIIDSFHSLSLCRKTSAQV